MKVWVKDRWVYSAEELSDIVKSTIEFYQSEAKEANERANKTYEEVKAQVKNDYREENEKLKEALQLSYGSFASLKEKESYDEFINEHRACYKNNKCTEFPFIISIGTGLGISKTVICPICEKRKDITDTEVW